MRPTENRPFADFITETEDYIIIQKRGEMLNLLQRLNGSTGQRNLSSVITSALTNAFLFRRRPHAAQGNQKAA